MTLKKILNLAVLCLVSACSSDPYNQGNYVDVSVLKGKENIWTRKDVEQSIGSPTLIDSKDPNVVYYIGAQGTKCFLMSPSIQKSGTLKLEYDTVGKLRKVEHVH